MKKPWMVLTFAVCLLLVLAFVLAGCGDGGGDDELIGSWISTDPDKPIGFEFRSDGTVVLKESGYEALTDYSVEDGTISLVDPQTGGIGQVEYVLDGDSLHMEGTGGMEVDFIRER